MEFTIGLPEDEFNRGALLTYLDENIDMENAMKEMMKNANPEYTQKSFSEGSPTDFADVRQLSVREKTTIWVPTRSDTSRAVLSQKLVRGWKFWI